MASAKLRASTGPQLGDMDMDMSPMIDLVFLLLIFFMVSSHLIIVQIDPEVKPPVATAAKPPENALGRIVVNIRGDGTITNANQEVISEGMDGPLGDVEAYIGEVADFQRQNQYKPRLHVRADRGVEVKRIKEVVEAAAAAQVIDVVFSAYVSSAYVE